MTDEAALLAACEAAPHDDTPPLVLADWYDDHGEPAKALERRLFVATRAVCRDPRDDAPRLAYAELVGGDRAKFIRVQVEIAELARRRVELFDAETDWAACTGIAASWCPNCGDCACPDRERRMDDPACPLHATDSPHACWDMLLHRAELAQAAERELFHTYGWPWAAADAPPGWFADLPTEGGQLRIMIPGESYDDPFPTYTVRRGFVDEMRAVTISALLGGACENCDGQGTIESPAYENTREPCPDCGGQFEPRDDESDLGYSPGTGRIPGVAAALFAAHPVTKILVADRRPSEWSAGADESAGLREWVWERSMADQPQPNLFTYLGAGPYNPTAADDAAILPPRVFDRMKGESGGHFFVIGKHSHRRYPTREAAVADLSEALVDECRELAGLGPLYGPAANP